MLTTLYHVPKGSKNMEPAKHAVAKLFQVPSIELHGPQLLDGGGQIVDRGDILFFSRGSSYGSNTSQFY